MKKVLSMLCTGALVLAMPASAFAAASTTPMTPVGEPTSAEKPFDPTTKVESEDDAALGQGATVEVTVNTDLTDDAENAGVELKGDTTIEVIQLNDSTSSDVESEALEAWADHQTTAVQNAVDKAKADGKVLIYQVNMKDDNGAVDTNKTSATFVITYNPLKFDGSKATVFYTLPTGETVAVNASVDVNAHTITFSVPTISGPVTMLLGEAYGSIDNGTDEPTVTPDVPADSNDNVDKADADKAAEKGADTGKTSPKTGINA